MSMNIEGGNCLYIALLVTVQVGTPTKLVAPKLSILTRKLNITANLIAKKRSVNSTSNGQLKFVQNLLKWLYFQKD